MGYLIAETAVFILIAGGIGYWLGGYLGKLSLQGQIALLEQRIGRRDEEIKELNQTRVALEKRADDTLQKLQTLQAGQAEQTAALEAAQAAASEQESARQEAEQALAALQQQVDAGAEEIAALTQAKTAAEAAHTAALEAANGLAAQRLSALEAAQAQASECQTQLAAAQQAGTAADDRIRELQAQCAELEGERGRWQQEQRQLEQALSECRGELAEAHVRQEAAKADEPAPPASATESESESESESETATDEPVPDAAPSAETAADESAADDTMTAPELLAAPAGEADNLRRIKGIGPKLADLLNEIGIYHYDQIAAFTPANAAWIDDRIRFKGRVEREKWVEQAKALVAASAD